MTAPDRWSGQTHGWRYLARRVTGSGTPGPWLDNEVPLLDVGITRVLSGPPQMTGRIEPTFARLLMPDGLPLLTEYDTELYAEKDGELRYGGHVVRNQYMGQRNEIEVNGFSGYIKGMGYGGDVSFTEVDPLDVVRHMWEHVQLGGNSDIGLVLDSGTTTPVRIGKPPVADDVSASNQSEGPYRLAWWLTDDMGEEVDALAKSTPFSYRERHRWNHDHTDVLHNLDFGYPTLGRRVPFPFVVGQNVQVVPTVERDGSEYANHVRVLGAGEGSAMIMAEARVSDGRLRRMITVTDDSIQDQNDARTRARDELAARLRLGNVSQIVVRQTADTQLGSWDVGDEIRLQSNVGWLKVDQWYKVISDTISPEAPELATLSLIRSDRLAA